MIEVGEGRTAEDGSSARFADPEAAIAARWLDTFNRVCARAAHELKGALNGVSVNVEVVRSRAEKPDVPASSVRTFAASASEQLDAVIDMTDALLALSRAPSGSVELAATVRRIAALLVPPARVDGKQIELDASLDGLGVTSASGTLARYVIADCLLAAMDVSAHVRCAAHRERGSTAPGMQLLRIERRDEGSLTASEGLVSLAAVEGVRIEAEPSAIVISFPR